MNDWSERLDAERGKFVEALVAHGFVLTDGEGTQLKGTVPFAAGAESADVEISLPRGWPYMPTRVRPSGIGADLSWHQESDGSMCLFPESSAGISWADGGLLLQKVEAWLDNRAAGWPDDTPDLDLERYFQRAEGDGLVLYDQIGSLIGKQIKVTGAPNGAREIRVSGKSAAKDARRGWVLDLGELDAPVRSWSDIRTRLGRAADGADRLVRSAKAAFILLRYERKGREAVLALKARMVDEEVVLEALQSANSSADTLRLRAGYDAGQLSQSTVVIVGMGAVGSLLADQLSRCGVGELILIDHEKLRPGNVIRHFAGPQHVGLHKALAVREQIRGLSHEPPRGIRTADARIRTIEAAQSVYEGSDLVIDATGDPSTSYLLSDAAVALRKKLIVVYLKREGDIIRLEVYPADPDAVTPIPESPVDREPLREAGCGDPVSPASPSAAAAAAANASLLAADILVGRPTASVYTHVLRGQLDDPYRSRAVIS